MNDRTVKIHLNGEKLNPPIKYTRARTGRPSRNFKFIPKMFRHLNDYVSCATWDYVEKTVSVTISETPKLEVVEWMAYVDKQYHDTQMSPFIDVDTNHALLIIIDDEGREVATLKLCNLKVMSHKTVFVREQIPDNFKFMEHYISLSYQQAEVIRPKEEPMAECKDDEWQTVELPA
jgi:uncharacterized protein YrzB (UPF0473 family)